jgi:ATP-dependent RNA helicase DeaD
MASPFENLGLLPQFVQVVEQMGFEQPTPIQQQAIPALLSGRNVIGQAQTGTGKTAAYALPLLQSILQTEPVTGKRPVRALVLAPTRELAIQVSEAAGKMAQGTSLRVLTVYGGQSYQIQTRQLERGVDVVVGTPGRLLDLMRQDRLDLSQVRFLVLDEADEMLEMGFIEDVETILAELPAERQMALFSATLPEAVRKLANNYLSDPLKISINPTRPTVAETEQRYCRVREEHKLPALTRLLEVEEVKSGLIFARTRVKVQELADELTRRGYPAESLHGDLTQSRREFVLNRFRQHTVILLVATDVAARGLDIEDVTHVFNFDVPEDAEDYVHRIGRTGRAGRKGIAITFLTPRERGRLAQIEAFTRAKVTEVQVPTAQDIQARRDERFMQRLTEQLGKGPINHERQLLARLEGTSFDMVEIAAAAIRLARAGEIERPVEEISIPAIRTDRPERFERPERSNRSERFERPAPVENAGPNGHKKTRRPEQVLPGEPIWEKVRGSSNMIRLKMNLGDAHGLRPGDVVGAIASEVGIPGKAIGEISILKNHTFVDVAEKHVSQVLLASTGKYFLRGKAVMLELAH